MGDSGSQTSNPNWEKLPMISEKKRKRTQLSWVTLMSIITSASVCVSLHWILPLGFVFSGHQCFSLFTSRDNDWQWVHLVWWLYFLGKHRSRRGNEKWWMSALPRCIVAFLGRCASHWTPPHTHHRYSVTGHRRRNQALVWLWFGSNYKLKGTQVGTVCDNGLTVSQNFLLDGSEVSSRFGPGHETLWLAVFWGGWVSGWSTLLHLPSAPPVLNR